MKKKNSVLAASVTSLLIRTVTDILLFGKDFRVGCLFVCSPGEEDKNKLAESSYNPCEPDL